MKIYLFYLVKDESNHPITCPKLYGITDSKEYRDMFMAFRDMTKFKLEVIKKDRIPDEFKDSILTIFPMSTEQENGSVDYIDFLVSWREEQETVLYPEKICNKLTEYIFPNIKIFKKEASEALDEGGYQEFYKFSKPVGYLDQVNNTKRYITHMKFDDFKVFHKLFGWTLSI